MTIPLYQIDAFTGNIFGGNPAAVCPLQSWLPDKTLQLIAIENNLSETAFFVPEGEGFRLRWFTPELEMDLCGHATLAAAHVLFRHLGYGSEQITFQSQSGPLTVTKTGELLTLDFPARKPLPAALPEVIRQGIGKLPKEVLKARDYVLVYETEEDVVNLAPDTSLLHTINLDPGGIVVTAPGREVDFVSRFFTPQASIFEDPVTGSAHCSLIPYWAERLQKTKLIARQVSRRVGTLQCELAKDRVYISGQAVTYLKGEIYLPQQV
ncbi:PhzF family phenazine biosynthesis protein [Pontibacter liquoris]|uniref:PhzF family phenazine biosynthesis protein n=1 Tax=Pontibacter liquoris TaxID=2905677 RepID=UPI001FA77CAE|nr:PhzF family phenazine biosynthesis protein [Pontibacter liquoris]